MAAGESRSATPQALLTLGSSGPQTSPSWTQPSFTRELEAEAYMCIGKGLGVCYGQLGMSLRKDTALSPATAGSSRFVIKAAVAGVFQEL